MTFGVARCCENSELQAAIGWACGWDGQTANGYNFLVGKTSIEKTATEMREYH
jgi:hypothetical protein